MGELGILDGGHEALSAFGVGGRNRKRAAIAWEGMKAKDRDGDHAESAEGAGDQFGQVVACNVFDDFAAATGERALRKSDGDPDDEVAESAKAKTKSAA